MKILLISDTHGNTNRVCEVFEKIKDVDLIVHLGDYEQDAIDLGVELGVDVASVGGNMDGVMNKELCGKILETEYGKIYLTHGHLEEVRSGRLDKLVYRCEELGCKAVFFGHTHIPYNEETNGIRIINPGSISQPRDGSEGSYAIIRTSEDRIECSILYYNSKGGLPKRKPQGGYLRGLINYSDGF